MFYTDKQKREIQTAIGYLDEKLETLRGRVETIEVSISALLKIATNKAKLDAEQSSVTVTVHAPHGLKKDGSPKKKPGPAIGSKRRVNK